MEPVAKVVCVGALTAGLLIGALFHRLRGKRVRTWEIVPGGAGIGALAAVSFALGCMVFWGAEGEDISGGTAAALCALAAALGAVGAAGFLVARRKLWRQIKRR